ncbi:MAG: RNA ligase family protein [Myxococcota bacterium]|nr:RNA ligase family protein [Myxococcota bacterium]
MSDTKYPGFPKVPRLNRDMVITEKLDGTNGLIAIEDGQVRAGSRNRWLSLDQDNFGFCAWVTKHADLLPQILGEGLHHGEWWGEGIQRRYGLEEKRFSLFNAKRWSGLAAGHPDLPQLRCVPVLYKGAFCSATIDMQMGELGISGSVAAPGFMEPEGVVVYHTAANQLFKATLVNDDWGKNFGA